MGSERTVSIELPDKIHEIRRYQPESGDILIFRNTEAEIDAEQADEIKRYVRQQLSIPYFVEIAVVGRDWEISVGKLP